jgi:Leucine-rich repeat (LRR) protein
MRRCIYYIIFLTLAVSCKVDKKENVIIVKDEILKNISKISIDTTLKTTLSDTLFVKSKQYSRWIDFYENTDGFCKKIGDTIFIFFKKGGLTMQITQLTIIKNSVSLKSEVYSCNSDYSFKPIETILTINKQNYNVNDILIGDLMFKGSSFSDITTITGKFKLKVMNSTYSFDNLTQDNNYNTFLRLAKTKSQQIKLLDLSNCGLTSIPKELSLFENVEELNLSENDLQNTDLSILSKLNKLKSISFQSCKLRDFPIVVLGLKGLNKLNIFGNRIKQLPEQLYELNGLTELEVGANDLVSISSNIYKLTQLKSFGFDQTKIRTLPTTIVRLKHLKEIYINDTMDYFPKELAKCLSSNFNYEDIKNYREFKDKIPVDKD